MQPDPIDYDELASRLGEPLEKLGFVRQQAGEVQARAAPTPAAPLPSHGYDSRTCARFLHPAHLGDGVLVRAHYFFKELATKGEVSSPEVVAALKLKGARSIPANLTIPLKKSAKRLSLQQPWTADETHEGRTLWQEREGIAPVMVAAIDAERARRGV